MTLFISLILFFIFLYLARPKSYIIVESAIASGVHSEIEIPKPIKLVNNISIKTDNSVYLLGSGAFSVIAAGDSMEQAGINKDDLIVFNAKFKYKKLKKGQIIAIRMPSDAKFNASKIKLRLFSHLGTDSKGNKIVCVDKYKKGTSNIVPSSNTHTIKSILGVKANVFNKEFASIFIEKYTIH